MSENLTHETIERAFKDAIKVTTLLPDNVERREAERHLKIAEDLTHASQEKHADR